MRRKEGGVGRTEPLAIDDANFHPLFSLSLSFSRSCAGVEAGVGAAPTHFIHHRTLAVAHIQLARARPPARVLRPHFPFVQSLLLLDLKESTYVRRKERTRTRTGL